MKKLISTVLMVTSVSSYAAEGLHKATCQTLDSKYKPNGGVIKVYTESVTDPYEVRKVTSIQVQGIPRLEKALSSKWKDFNMMTMLN